MQPLELSDVSGLAAGRFCHLGGYFVLGLGRSVYVGSSAFADVHSLGWNDGYVAVSCRSRLTSSEFMAPKRLRHV